MLDVIGENYRVTCDCPGCGAHVDLENLHRDWCPERSRAEVEAQARLHMFDDSTGRWLCVDHGLLSDGDTGADRPGNAFGEVLRHSPRRTRGLVLRQQDANREAEVARADHRIGDAAAWFRRDPGFIGDGLPDKAR